MAKGTVIAIITAFAEVLQSFSFTSNRNRHELFYLFGIETEQRSTSRTGVAGKRITQFYLPTLKVSIWIPQSGFKHWDKMLME